MSGTVLRRVSLLLPLLAALALPAPLSAGTLSVVDRSQWVSVAYVFDGDTFRTSDGRKVRLLGIDTPETRHDDEPGEPLAGKARAALREWIAGRQVRLRFDAEREDRYGRLLAQVYLRDDTWINARLVEKGLAHVYTFVPNLRWAEALLEREREARRERRGIWGEGRFRVLDADEIDFDHIGQFRLVRGRVESMRRDGHRFRMQSLNVSIPRKYRPYFEKTTLREGMRLLVRGTIRVYSGGRLFLALHSPADVEVIEP